MEQLENAREFGEEMKEMIEAMPSIKLKICLTKFSRKCIACLNPVSKSF